MSVETNDYYYNALLAQAAYGDFSDVRNDAQGNLDGQDIIDALTDVKFGSGFTQNQAGFILCESKAKSRRIQVVRAP